MNILSKQFLYTPIEPEEVPLLGNRVVRDNTLGLDKVILTKEYLNKYTPATFLEDLEVWLYNPWARAGGLTFGTNEAKYQYESTDILTVAPELYSIFDSGACLLMWYKTPEGSCIDIVNSSKFVEEYTSSNGKVTWLGLFLFCGEDSIDRDGLVLGSSDFRIAMGIVEVPPQ